MSMDAVIWKRLPMWMLLVVGASFLTTCPGRLYAAPKEKVRSSAADRPGEPVDPDGRPRGLPAFHPRRTSPVRRNVIGSKLPAATGQGPEDSDIGRLRSQSMSDPLTDAAPAFVEADAGATLSFETDIMPVLSKHGCNTAACHGSASGEGGLALSLFGAYPQDDYVAITKASAGRRIDRVGPAKSLFLLKAGGAITHKGGSIPAVDSPGLETLQSWLAQGAPWQTRNAADLTSIEIVPKTITLKKGESRKLKVTAFFADGKMRDVSADALYHSSNDAVASAPVGEIQATGCGQAAIVANYRRRSAIVMVSVPQPLPSEFPQVPENNKIDRIVFSRLRELGIPPSSPCTDAEFLRRVYLDVIGILPTATEARSFLADQDQLKRSKLIDHLLDREEYADYWAMKWSDLLRVKSEYPSNLWPNGVQAYYRWIRQAIVTNRPYSEIARDLLVSSGSNFRDPPCNYYRAVRRRDAQGFAEATALVFMGVRLECTRCHAHPTENWMLDDNLGMAAFFSQVRFKNTQEWKEEIVYLDQTQVMRHPTTREVVVPKFLDGAAVKLAAGEDLRARFAEWLTSPRNPWFARNIVNRIWSWLLGRGVVHEVDDLRPSNPPSNPELLSFMEKELIDHKYDLKHIYRLILNSRTYQLSSETSDWNAGDIVFFSHYPIRRLGAEQLLDAIGRVTGNYEEFSSNIPEPYTVFPKGWRAIQLADGSISTPALELFGRPSRDTPYESERCARTSISQALFLVSSAQLDAKVNKSPRLDELFKGNKTNEEIVDELYLSALSRPVSEDEKRKVMPRIGNDGEARKQSLRNLMWALINTKEFLFNH